MSPLGRPDPIFDRQMMRRAISLARQGRFTTTPNPNVGCVITQGLHIIGEGWHEKAGQAHAEVNALAQAKQYLHDNAATCTAYVTLEPCSHTGKTPPCADALIDAGIGRVVVAMTDPNPSVSGRGIERMRDAGIQVDLGLLSDEAETLNPGFLKRMRTGLPYVRLKMAASLDGKTALSNGQSQWITGEEARRDVQEWRAQSCAIVTGIGTALADNPSLTVRSGQWATQPHWLNDADIRQPLRVVMDTHNRLIREMPDANLFDTQAPTLIVHDSDTPELPYHVSDIRVPCAGKGLDLRKTLEALAARDVHTVWVEAGKTLAGSWFASGLVDELIMYVAPTCLGHHAQSLVALPDYTELSQAERWHFSHVNQFGDDLRVVLKPIQQES